MSHFKDRLCGFARFEPAFGKFSDQSSACTAVIQIAPMSFRQAVRRGGDSFIGYLAARETEFIFEEERACGRSLLPFLREHSFIHGITTQRGYANLKSIWN